nr:immunoglobulin heavy chain junction region [Macaca mulatta]MOV39025.1 immunoglobulin heavy chain junction region [Macaca mulatta]MOV39557.1 immunoglobulin heavy chain junction region [Macaca mulatta]MOV39917.1 immunoglobulin heavy chain junction region [Macaca mulatta]MOV40828.1 immunoglobulin heavy chain junction region [Macaca mulatta]
CAQSSGWYWSLDYW